jgi:leader peptidase (prepilin peptidase) / N-methyltransferase
MSTVAETAKRNETPERPAFAWSVPPGIKVVAAIGVAAATLIHFNLSGRAFVAAAFAAVLVILGAIDLERRIIPNRIVVPAGVFVLLVDIAAKPGHAKEWAIAAFATGVGAWLVAIASRGGLGMGDAKLCFLLGAGLGWNVVSALIYALVMTFVAALVVLLRRGLAGRKDAMPFGPFLALGAILALLLS